MIRPLRCALLVLFLLTWSLAPSGAAGIARAAEAAPPAARSAPAAGPAVNVNTAGVQELTTLPGIGPALAGRIVEHRKQNGPFRRTEDLLAVRGVGPKLLAKIKDRLTFDAPAAPR
jgi:competence protein ComEA